MKLQSRQIVKQIILLILIGAIGVVSLYNISGTSLFPLNLGKYLSIVLLLSITYQALISLRAAFLSAKSKNWGQLTIWLIFLVSVLIVGIGIFFLLLLYFGLIGNYTEGFY